MHAQEAASGADASVFSDNVHRQSALRKICSESNRHCSWRGQFHCQLMERITMVRHFRHKLILALKFTIYSQSKYAMFIDTLSLFLVYTSGPRCGDCNTVRSLCDDLGSRVRTLYSLLIGNGNVCHVSPRGELSSTVSIEQVASACICFHAFPVFIYQSACVHGLRCLEAMQTCPRTFLEN